MSSSEEASALVAHGESEGAAFSAAAAARRWGIGISPWLWATRLRILFVIDGRVTTGRGADEFGLGLVLDTLADPSFAWWVRFEVEVVNRNDPRRFRFSEQGFDIDDWDQVWFFGDWPGPIANDTAVGDDVIDNPQYAPLGDDELAIVAAWMERGGGVFATGDHALLGASMCSRIPRVRTMRKWTRAQGVPSFGDEDRHETLQHAPGGNFGSWEGDRWPQRLYPVYRMSSPFVIGRFPHPLLCGKDGVIDEFPDHMHEGGVIEDDDVQLNLPLDIPGFKGDEYPFVPVEALPALVGAPEPFGVRPRPEVIAHGWTTNLEANPVRFAIVGVYDGDSVGLGRVVVDSTWHHWFSMNLLGFRDESPGFYRGMQGYYRNVALWLATPEQRASMLFAATWGAVVGVQPGLFDRALGIWDIGERALDVIGRTAPQCIVSELVATFLQSPAERLVSRSQLLGRPARPTADIATEVHRAMVGGIAYELIDFAQHLTLERLQGRLRELDRATLRERALAGVAAGRRELVAYLDDTASTIGTTREELMRREDSSTEREIPIDVDSWERELGPDKPMAT